MRLEIFETIFPGKYLKIIFLRNKRFEANCISWDKQNVYKILFLAKNFLENKKSWGESIIFLKHQEGKKFVMGSQATWQYILDFDRLVIATSRHFNLIVSL